MTRDEFVEIFYRYQIPDSIEVDHLTLCLMLRKPTNLDYLVSGLMDKRDRKGSFWIKKFMFGRSLLTHNFRYRMSGTATGPEGCFEQNCELEVNTEGMDTYRSREANGTIGAGVFNGKAFNLKLDVTPEIAKNIVERRLLAPEVELGYKEDEERGPHMTWLRLSLDILDVRKQRDDRVFFSIGRAYFSSMFSPFQFY